MAAGETAQTTRAPDARYLMCVIGCLASFLLVTVGNDSERCGDKTSYLYMGNILQGRNLPPIICTLDEAKAILGPVTVGYTWGEGTIKDLWSQCAPTPDSGPGRVEKRIISPAHLGEWLADVLERQGRPMTDQASVYSKFVSGVNRGG